MLNDCGLQKTTGEVFFWAHCDVETDWDFLVWYLDDEYAGSTDAYGWT